MAQPGVSNPEPPAGTTNFLKRFFGRGSSSSASPADASSAVQGANNDDDMSEKPGLIRRVSRKVVPGLPRVQTFKRQQSEKRTNLAPVKPTPAERRAVSVDRRAIISRTTSHTGTSSGAGNQAFPRASAPELFDRDDTHGQNAYVPLFPASPNEVPEYAPVGLSSTQDSGADSDLPDDPPYGDRESVADTGSVTSTQIHEELEKMWILNLSMHFRDKSKREKFFVTYREHDAVWRRVTVSVDYRGAPENSLEADLLHTKFQREKSTKIYEAIRESLEEIQFYDTVTNLKLQTTDGRLHVHVVEDVNEIIDYPTVRQVRHLGCPLVRERDIIFDSHMSGFVYKVLVGEEVLIKKEIPGPDTIEEFLYEVNALSALRFSKHVIRFYGLVVDDQDQYVKGLLISYANQGALIDVIFDHRQESIESGRLEASIPWPRRVKWARQVVEGLSDIHESGFVQGDFTLSNIVIDDRGDAKIIDINRRGCPVGWEPPEATPLIESNQRISMYIGVKSDLFQLGMVLWGLAMEDDEPEAHQRPLILNEEASNIPEWYRQMTEICLSKNPRMRMQASSLLSLFPADDGMAAHSPLAQNYLDPYGVYTRNGDPSIRTVSPTARWPYDSIPATYDSGFGGYESSFNDPVRGRSPPRHFPGSLGAWDAQRSFNGRSWSHSGNIASYSDVGEEYEDHSKSATPTTNRESSAARNRPIDEAKDVVSGHEATIIEEVHDADVGDGTLKNPIPASEDGDVADVADVSSRAVDHLAEETRTVEDSTKVETGPQVGQETMPVLTIGVETCSEEGKNSIVGCNEKASCCVSSVADPGNTEPDVQIDSGAGIQGLQFETDASGVAAEDAELTGSAKPTAPVVETADIDGTKIASTAEDTNCDSKKDDSAAEAASELPLSEEPPQPSAQPASSPSVAKVPDALTGVGAAYDIEHPNLSKITTELEEELHLMDTTAGVPAEATTGTTDLDN